MTKRPKAADLTGALRGLRVLDASRVLAGPFCGQILADLGAELIKVEQPGQGDETRMWGPPFVDDLSSYFLACNRNKKSLALDLKSAAGQAVFFELARRSDVLLENFRPESRVKFGLTEEQLLQINPRLILCSISGFGLAGPLAGTPGYDFVVQGMSGMMAMNGPVAGEPYKFGVAIADIVTGLYATTAVLAGLHAREKSAHGYAIDLALLDCAVAAQVNVTQAFLSTGKQPGRVGNAHLQIAPYEMFRAADGYLIIAVGNDGQWRRFCAAVGMPELASEARFANNAERVKHREALSHLLTLRFRQKSVADWLETLRNAEVPHGPVWDFAELFASEQAHAAKLKITARDPTGKTVELVRSPLLRSQSQAAMPPKLGEHSRSILKDVLGFDQNRIDRLFADGIVTE